MEETKVADLNAAFTEGESADRAIFAEMRSNVLLHSGEHYKKTSDKILQRLKDSRTSETMKLKLTKNHTQVITKTYISNIVSQAPGVTTVPYNENELRDQKDAELSKAVWQNAEEQENIDSKIDEWASHFIIPGEIIGKIYWNPNKGTFKGFRQKLSDDGNPLFQTPDGQLTTEPHSLTVDQMGQPQQVPHEPVPGDEAVFSGKLEIETIFPANLIRPKQCESLDTADWLGIRKMLSISDAKAMLGGIEDDKEREEKLSYIVESGESTFKVFDGSNGDYADTKDQVLIKEMYYRPCPKYPKGYFYIFTEKGTLFSGELPFGEFPIVTEGFDKMPTSPRHRSIIKALRGPQQNINLLASKKYEHVITMGDDKIITQQGSKLSKGSNWAGIREFNTNGSAPVVIQGRSGEQFESSIMSEIAELYKLANLDYEMAEVSQQDPWAKLYASLAQRKKYAMYVRKFERFLCNVAKLYLRLARHYLPDDYIIKAVGKREAINIAEFKATSEEGFRIKLKPMSNDIESMMGKQLSINTVTQYFGKDLPENVKGKLLRAMPFLNEDQMFNDLTLDDENIESDILALDRGEYRPATPADKHDLYIARIGNRMKQSDFRLLTPQSQQMYAQKLQEHVKAQAEQVKQLKQMEAGFIPTGGGLVKIDLYGADGKRMLAPQEALNDLMKKLEAQGTMQAQLQQMNQANQLQVLQQSQLNSQQQGPPQPQAGVLQQQSA